MIRNPLAAAIMNAVSEAEYELSTLEALAMPPLDSALLARWNAGLDEARSGLEILTELAKDMESAS